MNRCRILKTESEEGAEMLTALKAVDPSWRVITNLFDLSYVVLKEFVHVSLFIYFFLSKIVMDLFIYLFIYF